MTRAEIELEARAWVATVTPHDGSPSYTTTVYGRNATAAEERAAVELRARVIVRAELSR